ncbi:hypothetical protein KC19_2G216300 [Ceratodon purpureus]|uniref:Uncharacterized protein n=1 Tax=Ceratodon purpureus TaxID=3225 RepID=A0A8T0IZD7_CERPU|nr:hypothetical protein KC19_2G216300 [Ceratodon purpureus]
MPSSHSAADTAAATAIGFERCELNCIRIHCDDLLAWLKFQVSLRFMLVTNVDESQKCMFPYYKNSFSASVSGSDLCTSLLLLDQ